MRIICNIFIDRRELSKDRVTCDLYCKDAAHEHAGYVDKADSLDADESVRNGLVIRH